MRETTIRVFLVQCCRVAACGALLTVMTGDALRTVSAQSAATPASSEIPDLVGVWDGGPRARPVNGKNMPWNRRQLSRAERASAGASGRLR